MPDESKFCPECGFTVSSEIIGKTKEPVPQPKQTSGLSGIAAYPLTTKKAKKKSRPGP